MSGGFALQLAVEFGIFGDHGFQRRPIDGVPAWLAFYVAHFLDRCDTIQDELGLIPGIDHGRLLAHGELRVLHRRFVVWADEDTQRIIRFCFGHELRLHHALDQRFHAGKILRDQVVPYRQNAVGIAGTIDIGAVGQLHAALDVMQQGGGIRLDSAEHVQRAGAKGFHRFRGVAHVTNRDVLEADAAFLEPVVRHHLQRIHLEGPECLALQFVRRIKARLGDQNKTFDPAAGDDGDGRACIVQGDETGVGHKPRVDLAAAQERHHLRGGRRRHEVDDQPIVLCGLQRVRQEVIEITETGAVDRLDMGFCGGCRTRRAVAESQHHGTGSGGTQQASAVEQRRHRRSSKMFTHGSSLM